MRLAKIKIAGFKSFVDPTTINLPSNLIGIVGPNGCGKSNVIDAVRWVMGESSAKNLRGESMEDVIFNGSSTRKPVGTASIELNFDNSDGKVGGQYASFTDISVKRLLSRDGTSNYYLNGTKCRRKDITHLFLGTGLGPRSYAIIEQGMISRLIEARPEEMRVYLEEAAGISKYKDRRRETESRISHTRENLERLKDLRDEVDKHIKHLHRQARVAERFKELKQDERHTTAELLALKLAVMDQEITRRKHAVTERQTRLEASIASQRATENEIETTRGKHTELTDGFNIVQGNFYSIGSEIARLEQSIHHAEEMRQRQTRDLEQAAQGLKDIQEHIAKDQSQIIELEAALHDLEPTFDQAQESLQASAVDLQQAQAEMQGLQHRWDENSEQINQAQQKAGVERAKLENLDAQIGRSQARSERIQAEIGNTDVHPLLEKFDWLQQQLQTHRGELEELEAAREGLVTQVAELRSEEHVVAEERDKLRGEIRSAGGRLASLEALQQAALGQNEAATQGLLDKHGLGSSQRLAQCLSVASGWERAVETVLGECLEAVLVEDLGQASGLLGDLEKGHLAFFDSSASTGPGPHHMRSLADKVSGEPKIDSLLGAIRIAESLDEALAMRSQLGAGESVISRDGVWVGPNWLRVTRGEDVHAGVFERESEIRNLRSFIEEKQDLANKLESRLSQTRTRLEEQERQREGTQAKQTVLYREQSRLNGELESHRSQIEQATRQKERLGSEFQEVSGQLEELKQAVNEARGRLELAIELLAQLNETRSGLQSEREQLNRRVLDAERGANEDRVKAQQIQLEIQSRRSTRENALAGMDRMRLQLSRFEERKSELDKQLLEAESPILEQRRELQEKLKGRVRVESRLQEARKALEDVDTVMRELDGRRLDQEMAVNAARETLDETRMAAQEITLRREALFEQFRKTEYELEAIAVQIPEDAEVEKWEQRLESISNRIGRLGPINLAAIDEFKEESERQEYLNAQNNDLEEALHTLENAIRKIDRETRTRFKETYDLVNAGLKQNFPRLFGGGHAYLELGDEDLLTAGVTVMARPPGKRNSSIHLLSGGEKALTAVALVFAIFQLNPAPFCLLDEVDAPLDDANVTRFCEIVREMSEKVQFLFITHNKVTMELANQLTGVTMQEPGVSRLVSVDVEEAVQMAAM